MSLPARIHASQAIAHGGQHEGELACKQLPRLSAELARQQARLMVRMRASDAPGYPVLQGSIEGQLPLACRRCGALFDWPVSLRLDLRLVFSEREERQALRDSEPYRVENDELPLRDIVEDEVLLALPMLPRCPSCENAADAAESGGAAASGEARRENPFAVLKDQLKK